MTLPAHKALALAADASKILVAQGIAPDPWQRQFLLSPARQALLNCSRQAGKSTVVSALALHTALFQPDSLVILLSPSQRQSHELFRKVLAAYSACGRPVPTVQDAQTLSKLELANGSRIVGLPGREGTIRGFSRAALLIIDEAARVPDDLYRSVRPMLAVSRGRLVALSTPFGQRGWFFSEWHHGAGFHKVLVPWDLCPRISPSFIESEEASLGKAWVDQEYRCLFTALEGLVYPDFETCVWDESLLPSWLFRGQAAKRGFASATPPAGDVSSPDRHVGGIDFGWRNPFAAVWGALDRDDVLWITGERYLRETPLHEHAKALKAAPGVTWYADPAGATEIAELRAAGLKVLRADNDIRHGIAALTARIRTKRLRVNLTSCPNLIAEARLYRYPSPQERAHHGENPIDDNNHALAALRYLISRLDHRFIARLRRRARIDGAPDDAPTPPPSAEAQAQAERWRETQRGVFGRDTWDDDDLWSGV